ncbi:ABC transporter permease DevC [Cyanobium sp. Morenito 9A2]|uniref:ABC transporter permease DevC n=1 Tax=Cyanobium sp. Morenito 9A2 TaxID=2823718 RepID=UPI0020CCAB92|nr:ABC transporter permease DevC [Cyanobium sp. Morenito 9A2]MCP9849909.1 FtsX-like permease family protein [Cyanobium sp. Morenito 9A2]
MSWIRRLIGRLNLADLPLAWLQLKRQPIRYLVAVTGIGFAALLMYMQLGFQSGLLNSATTFYEALDADLVLISPGTLNSGNFQQFPQSLLFNALGVEGVQRTIPLYVANVNVQKLGGVKPTSLRLIGYDPEARVLNLPAVLAQSDRLKTPNYVLFDTLGNRNTGPIAAAVKRNGAQELILSDFSKTFRVVGLFNLGSTFAADSNLISSDSTAIQLAFRQINEGEISLGLIRLSPGTDSVRVQDFLRRLYGRELQVLNKVELIAQERDYWNTASSFGVIFGFGTIMGLLVGGVVVYQVLYTDVSDHLKEYATLKAMGFADGFILTIVIQEAFLLGVSAFIPATLIATGMYAFLTSASGIRIEMSADKTGLVGALTLGVCAASAAIAIRKIKEADPASVF